MTDQELINNANAFSKIDYINMLKKDYNMVKVSGNIAVVRNNDHKWGIVSIDGNVIVPFGKYDWIDEFDSGLARVRTKGEISYSKNILGIITVDGNSITSTENIREYKNKERQEHPERYAKWGIINEKGEEVLPLEYDDIWGWCGKNRYSTKVIKSGVSEDVFFHDLNPSLPIRGMRGQSRPNTRRVERDYFSIDDCFDNEGNFDQERLDDAIMDGLYVPEDW